MDDEEVPLSVLLVGNYAPDRQFSMLGFADCLEREYRARGLRAWRIAPTPRLGRASAPPKLRKWLAYADKYLLFPRFLKKAAARCDLVHILDHGNAMYVRHVADRPHVVTCHDLLAIRASIGEIPGWTIGGSGRKYQSMILAGLRQARHIAAVSRATLEDVLRIVGKSENDVQLVYNGVYQPIEPFPLPEARHIVTTLGIVRPYLLVVGYDSPYKNRAGALEIHRQLGNVMGDSAPDLVVAGKSNPASGPSARILEDPRVRYVDAPGLPTLTALYQCAQGLLFPSWNEGFGLPILEAQLLECPVFTTNRAPMTEVGGNAACYFDPETPVEAARTIADRLPHSQSMKEEGLLNAKRFSTNAMIANYVSLYERILGGGVQLETSTSDGGDVSLSSYRGDGRVRN